MDNTQNAGATRFSGQPFDMGGKTFIVPALSLSKAKELSPVIQRIREIGSSLSAESIEQMMDIVLAAVQRNYPDITRAELESLIDLSNFITMFRAALGGRVEAAPTSAVSDAA